MSTSFIGSSRRASPPSTLSRADAATAVDAVVSAIADTLASGEHVAIAVSKAPAFRAAAWLRNSVNRGK